MESLLSVACESLQEHIDLKLENVKIPVQSNVDDETKELLGSVTTFPTSDSSDTKRGPAVRTSARVIHKLRMDSKPEAPLEKEAQNETLTVNQPKTPSHSKAHVRVQWINQERNFFFDALNEHGRDFEQIARIVNNKMRRKSPSDQDYKTKDHIRQHYYQIYMKASKYLRFSEDVKRHAQELYTLINYGEMKRKLVMSSEKSFLKLRDLVYKGFVTIRLKGKNIKIKTPSCRALRKLNQLEGNTIESIQLPQRIEVILRPVNMKSWGYVQTLAQNPRIRMLSLPLQKRLASLLYTMQQKWLMNNSRLYDKYVNTHVSKQGKVQKIGDEIFMQAQADTAQLKEEEPTLCFMPPRKTAIHRPMVQLNELLSSYNICLNSYEERIGATTRGENLCSEKFAHIKDLLKHPSKRMRFDSASDKKTKVEEQSCKINSEELGISVIDHKSNDSTDNELKKKEVKEDVELVKPTFNFDVKKEEVESSSSAVSSTLPLQVKSDEQPNQPTTSLVVHPKPKKRDSLILNPKTNKEKDFKPLMDEEMLGKIRKGWTLQTAGDLTIGDLYLMFGSDSKLILEYNIDSCNSQSTPDEEIPECKVEDKKIGNKLKNLVAIANLMEGNTKLSQPSYIIKHGCERNTGDNHNESLFKAPAPGPRNSFDALNRSMNTRAKAPQSRWRQNHRARPMTSQLMTAAIGNHTIREVYQTPPVVESSSSQNQSDKYDEVTKILEEKIQDYSGKAKANEFSENSRSSMRSLLDCFSSNKISSTPSIGDGKLSISSRLVLYSCIFCL